jgi:NitT/TauT family transport system permease protein
VSGSAVAQSIGRTLAGYADRFAPLLTGIGLLIVWEVGCRVFKVPSFLLPAPSVILSGATEQTWTVWANHIWATVRVALFGYGAAILLTIPLAIALASSRLLSRTLLPLIVVVHATPIVAVAPIIVVTLGVSDAPRIAITFLITFFPIIVSTTTGLLAAPPEMIELSRSLRAGRTREMLHIRIPFAIPYIFSGLRISITLAFVAPSSRSSWLQKRVSATSFSSPRPSSRSARPLPRWSCW